MRGGPLTPPSPRTRGEGGASGETEPFYRATMPCAGNLAAGRAVRPAKATAVGISRKLPISVVSQFDCGTPSRLAKIGAILGR